MLKLAIETAEKQAQEQSETPGKAEKSKPLLEKALERKLNRSRPY